MRENQQFGFRPCLTQTGLYSHRSRLEAGNFGYTSKKDYTICVAKTKALISFTVTAKLICAFVFAYANCWFFDAVDQMLSQYGQLLQILYATEHAKMPYCLL